MTSLEPTTLEGVHIRLVPLSLSHHAELCEVGLDEELWRFTTIRLQNPEDMFNYLQAALKKQSEGSTLAFVIIEKVTGKIIGTSRYHSLNRAHRRLEIGFTWIGLRWQRTVVNTEVKYLMLKHAFEQYKCVRVEFSADSSNEKSCRALRRIGAKQEGILRKYVISKHKGPRDVVVFSILDNEWPEVATNLKEKLRRGKDS